MRKKQKVREGVVISDRMDKTVTIEIADLIPHALFGKVTKRRSKIKVHDDKNESRIGDIISVIEARPRSKTKRWRLLKIVSRVESAGS